MTPLPGTSPTTQMPQREGGIFAYFSKKEGGRHSAERSEVEGRGMIPKSEAN